MFFSLITAKAWWQGIPLKVQALQVHVFSMMSTAKPSLPYVTLYIPFPPLLACHHLHKSLAFSSFFNIAGHISWWKLFTIYFRKATLIMTLLKMLSSIVHMGINLSSMMSALNISAILLSIESHLAYALKKSQQKCLGSFFPRIPMHLHPALSSA